MSSPVRGFLGIAAASILWGTTGTAASFAIDLSPLAIGAFAMGVAALLLGLNSATLLHRHFQQIVHRPLLLCAGGGAVAIYPLAFYSSMHLAGVAMGTVVSIASAPLFAALLEWIFDKRAVSQRWMVSFVLGVIGIVMLYAGKVVPPESANEAGSSTFWGLILGLVAGLTYSLYSWVAKVHISSGIASRASMAAMFLLSSLVLLPSLVFTGENLFAGPTNTGVVIYMALVPMFLGYLCFGYGLKTISASSATLITLLEPAVAVILAVGLLGEQFQLIGWLGVSAILLSMLIQLERRS